MFLSFISFYHFFIGCLGPHTPILPKNLNFFNKKPSEEWFVAAEEVGIQFVRVVPDKWKGESQDFLLGNADAFEEISHKDLHLLKKTLDQASLHGIKVVLSFLSLPGSCWRQNNHGEDDLRLWQNREYQKQAISCWRRLSSHLKDHPAIVGYNILNEPHPEVLSGASDFRDFDFRKWSESMKESLADLNLFYKNVVDAVREVDSHTPIILDTGFYATPWAISYLIPINRPGIIYSFHMYEPYAYTTRKINRGRYEYPGNVPVRLTERQSFLTMEWNDGAIKEFLQPIVDWQTKYHIPSEQILVGEFGCDRTAKGADKYLKDLIKIFNENKWHWAFYSFREDSWDSMDYELGSSQLDAEYWNAVERGANLDSFRRNNPLFDIIKEQFG